MVNAAGTTMLPYHAGALPNTEDLPPLKLLRGSRAVGEWHGDLHILQADARQSEPPATEGPEWHVDQRLHLGHAEMSPGNAN